MCHNTFNEHKKVNDETVHIITHVCNGIIDHIETVCVCRCGFWWNSTESKKDSIGA